MQLFVLDTRRPCSLGLANRLCRDDKQLYFSGRHVAAAQYHMILCTHLISGLHHWLQKLKYVTFSHAVTRYIGGLWVRTVFDPSINELCTHPGKDAHMYKPFGRLQGHCW
jgi:hypothetical protein